MRAFFLVLIAANCLASGYSESLGKPRFPTKAQLQAQANEPAARPIAALTTDEALRRMELDANATKISIITSLGLSAVGYLLPLLPDADVRGVSMAASVVGLLAAGVGMFSFFDYLDVSIALANKSENLVRPLEE